MNLIGDFFIITMLIAGYIGASYGLYIGASYSSVYAGLGLLLGAFLGAFSWLAVSCSVLYIVSFCLKLFESTFLRNNNNQNKQ